MTREEQLKFCVKCLNRKHDLKQGIICSLTGQKAAFENECADFKLDIKVPEPMPIVQEYEEGQVPVIIPAEIYEKLRLEQNLIKGIVAGLAAGILCSILWAVITVATNYIIGYMAIAVGAGVGISIGYMGKGLDPIFGIFGAAISFLSCVLGNMLSVIGFVANEEGVGYLKTLFMFDYSLIPSIMKEGFSPMDVIFYGLAIYEGYKFSFRVISEQEVNSLKKK